MDHSGKKVVILGINGRIGQEIAKAFVQAGYGVSGMGRENRANLPNVNFILGNADNVGDLKRAIDGQAIVVNALNLPYDKWENGRAEAQAQRVADALKGSGKLLMFPGNIYNFSDQQHVLTPQTPFAPVREKGHIRVRVEQIFQDLAVQGHVQLVIVRSGDFYAPFATETNFDLAIFSRKKAKILQVPHEMNLKHTWAYMPDLAKVYVALAERADQFSASETFHFRGHVADGHQLVAAIQAALPAPWKVSKMPWGMLWALGLVIPVLGAVVKMNYLFRTPHELKDERLDTILGPDFDTPFEEAVARAVQSYVPHERAEAGAVLVAN